MVGTIRKIYNEYGDESGAILSGHLCHSKVRNQKNDIEKRLMHFAITKLYPGQALSFQRELHGRDLIMTVLMAWRELPIRGITI